MNESINSINLTQGIYKSYIELCRDVCLWESYKHQYFWHKKDRQFSVKFKYFFNLINHNIDDFQKIIKTQDLVSQVKSFPYRFINGDFDNKEVLEYLTFFNLGDSFILKDLNLSYKILWNSSPSEELNFKYLRLFFYRFNYLHLEDLILFFQQSIMNEKEFDAIQILEPILFLNNQVNPFLINFGLGVYVNSLVCFSYLRDEKKMQRVLSLLYEFDDSMRSLQSSQSYHIGDIIANKIGITNLNPENRKVFENYISDNLDLNRGFTNLVEIENAFRLGFMEKDKYLKIKKKIDDKEREFTKNNNILLDNISQRAVLNLSIDENIVLSNRYLNEIEYPNANTFDEISEYHLINYKFIFYGADLKLDNIVEYLRIRLIRLFKEFTLFNDLSEAIIKELSNYMLIAPTYIKNDINFYISEINSYLKLKDQDKLNNVVLLMNKIRDVHSPIIVKIGRQIESFPNKFSFEDALAMDYAFIVHGVQYGSNASLNDYIEENDKFKIFHIMYDFNNQVDVRKASDIKFNDLKDLGNCHKVISLLENPCEKFFNQYLKVLPSTSSLGFYHDVFIKLIKAMIRIKNFDKAKYWANKYIRLLDENPTICRNNSVNQFAQKLKKDFDIF